MHARTLKQPMLSSADNAVDGAWIGRAGQHEQHQTAVLQAHAAALTVACASQVVLVRYKLTMASLGCFVLPM